MSNYKMCPSYSPDFVEDAHKQKEALAALNAAYARHLRLENALAVMMSEISIDDKGPVNQCKSLVDEAMLVMDAALAVAIDAVPDLMKHEEGPVYTNANDDDMLDQD
jgi:hypothetical protein